MNSNRRPLVCALLLTSMTLYSVAATGGWEVRSTPSTNRLNGVTYGPGLFVAAGSQASVLTSGNGISWTHVPLEMTAPTFYCATFDHGRYVLGGGEGALIRSSTDGVNWTNGLSTIGAENVNGLCGGYGFFVGVGRGTQVNTAYILISSNGLDWISRSVPTTNTLFAVSPAIMADGSGWATGLLVAVGDRGTILTSADGLTWATVNSGTTVALRAVTFHKGTFIAGGDNGRVIYSSNGTNWNAAAPADMDVRGMASSGDSLVIVGNYTTEGKLHASSDGLTWPGPSLVFPKRLNAIAWNGSSFVAVGDGGFVVQSQSTTAGEVNSWVKPTSGNWEEPFWSLAALPGPEQAAITITNAGWKAVAIASGTTANYAPNLTVPHLTVSAPSNSFNQLLLNYSGLTVPLHVQREMILGPNASLAGYYSALRAGSLFLQSPAALSDCSLMVDSNLVVGTTIPAGLNLTNCSSAAKLLLVSLSSDSGLTQSGGMMQLTNLVLFAGSTGNLINGSVIAKTFDLQSVGDFPLDYGWQIRAGLAQFAQSGGRMEFEAVRMGTRSQTPPVGTGQFVLHSGSFKSSVLDVHTGSFTQNGGTNNAGELRLPPSDASDAQYWLLGGTLLSSNLSVGKESLGIPGTGNFTQSAGVHSNGTMLLAGEIRKQAVTVRGQYLLNGGLLAAKVTTVRGGRFTQSGGTNLIQQLTLQEAGSFQLTDGAMVTSNTTVSTILCVEGIFAQSGGNHSVKDLLLDSYVRYDLQGGNLFAENIFIARGARLIVSGGTVLNSGTITLRKGLVRVFGPQQQLGPLQVLEEPDPIACISPPQGQNAAIDLGNPFQVSSLVRFGDSHAVAWSAPLLILNWCATNGPGPDHIFFGTSSQGLSPAQLSQVFFVNPLGDWPMGTYPATMLPTGEIVPAALQNLAFQVSAGRLVLTWSGAYQLTTTTNLANAFIVVPGALSPWTNNYADPSRFFRLAPPP